MPDTDPRQIEKLDDDALRIVWGDGHDSRYTFRYLRQTCPCAACRDEWTGKRLLDPESVPKHLKAFSADVVGNYALSFGFEDHHGSGIYSFEALRRLCPCPECAARAPQGPEVR